MSRRGYEKTGFVGAARSNFALCSLSRPGEDHLPAGDEVVKAEAERGFAEILELWHARKYDELYGKTLSSGKQTKKEFCRQTFRRPAQAGLLLAAVAGRHRHRKK